MYSRGALVMPLVSFVWSTRATYTWPNPMIDTLEKLYVSLDMANVLIPCSSDFPGGPGIQTAAEWLRTAYHDMATADVTKGTGGIDASIGYETDRPENVGAAFNNSIEFFSAFQTPYVSMADVIALGAVLAVRACGTSAASIPYRAGRVDALQGGPSGVPEPTQDLASHKASFKRQGFNVTEMIGLVACGHTIGGVHGEDFPNITAGISEPDTLGQTIHFDSSFDNFDNKVATDFVSNKSQDVLVIGPNETNSDLRIFNADGGALMKDFAGSNDHFISTCKSLLERMINTVPKGVKLSDVISPIQVKPENLILQMRRGGTFELSGTIRLPSPTENSNRQVLLHVNGRDGSKCATIPASVSEDSGVQGFFGNFTRYNFNQTLPVDKGVASFTVEVKEQGRSRIANNGGSGFPVADAAVFQLQDSCFHFSDSTRNFTLAVRDNAHLSSLKVVWNSLQGLPGTQSVSFPHQEAPMVKGSPIGKTGYTTYFANSTFNTFDDFFDGTYDIVGKDAHGKDFRTFGPGTSFIGFC